MNIKITNIEWDIDGDDTQIEILASTLPFEHQMDIGHITSEEPTEIQNQIEEYLENEFGKYPTNFNWYMPNLNKRGS